MDVYDNHLYSSSDTDLLEDSKLLAPRPKGNYTVTVNYPLYNLNTGNYKLRFVMGQINVQYFDIAEVYFSIENKNFLNTGNRPGIMLSINEWHYQ